MTAASPEIKATWSLRCFIGSMFATAFWPSVVLLVLFALVMGVRACNEWSDHRLAQMRAESIAAEEALTDEQRLERLRASERAHEQIVWFAKYIAAPAGGVAALFLLSGLLGHASGLYYDKCNRYWTTSDDPTWRGALRAMREDMTRAFAGAPRDPDPEPTALEWGWDFDTDEVLAFDAEQRTRCAALIAALPPAQERDEVETYAAEVALYLSDEERVDLLAAIAALPDPVPVDPSIVDAQPGAQG